MNFDFADAIDRVVRRVSRAVAPPPKLTVSEWADAHRRLSPEAAAEPGRWKTDRAPYQRGMMDAFSDPRVRQVVVKASAQVGKTEALLNVLGFSIHHDPQPVMVVMPGLDLAESFSKDRLAPMIRDTPVLTGKVSDVKQKNGGNTILKKKFRGGQLTLSGANSAASLSSRPVRMVLLDEVDRYPASAGTEGDPANLAIARTKTFTHNKKIGAWSTPTIKGTSRIDQMFEESDQRFFNLPCPHCGKLIVLKFDRFHWDEGRPETVRYLCNACDAVIEENEKAKMLKAGRWVATKPFADVAGFHIWEAYSPWVKWKDIVAAFIMASKQGPDKLKTFVNTSLGECWEQKGDAPEWEKLYERREDYAIGSVPDVPCILTAGADVQADRIECEVVAWTKNLESFSVDYRVFRGSTAVLGAGAWVELEKLLGETFKKSNGTSLPITMMGVDSGYSTQTVYNWVRKFSPTRVIATKGRDSLQHMIGTPSKVDIVINGKKHKRGMHYWPIGVNLIKSETYALLKLAKPSEGQPFPAGYCHFPQYDPEFFKMLTAEQLVIRKNAKGFSHYEWEKLRERNESLDTRVINRACAALIGIDRFSDERWAEIENSAPPPVQARTSEKTSAPDKQSAPKRRPSSFL